MDPILEHKIDKEVNKAGTKSNFDINGSERNTKIKVEQIILD